MSRLPSDHQYSAEKAEYTSSKANKDIPTGGFTGSFHSRHEGTRPKGPKKKFRIPNPRVIRMMIPEAVESRAGRRVIKLELKKLPRNGEFDSIIQNCSELLEFIDVELKESPFHDSLYLEGLKLNLTVNLLNLLPYYKIKFLVVKEEESIAIAPHVGTLDWEFEPIQVVSEEKFFEDLGINFK